MEPEREEVATPVPPWVWWVAGGVLLLALTRTRPAPTIAVDRDTPAERLRALVIPPASSDRVSLLRRYQLAEGVTPSNAWNSATAQAAELRLSDFPPAARAGLVAAMERDPFFRPRATPPSAE